MWSGWTRLAASVAAAAIVTMAAAGCGGDDDDAGTGSDTGSVADGGTLVVKMLDNSFKPATITVKAGTTVTFELPNVGKLPHNMHIASLRGVYRESPWISKPELINGGQKGKLTWEVPTEAGVYKFRCDYHEAEMVGTITVE